MNNSNHFPQMPEGGNGRIRALLDSIKENENRLNNHPLYKEGYDDGIRDADTKYRQLTTALSSFYNIKED